MREEARRELAAAVEERERAIKRADAEIDRALVAAHELGVKADALIAVLGVSQATYFRRLASARKGEE